jgi:hypothetical protein
VKEWLQLFPGHYCKHLESDLGNLDEEQIDCGVDIDASLGCEVFCTAYFWKALREKLEALCASFLVGMEDGWYWGQRLVLRYSSVPSFLAVTSETWISQG